MYLSSRETIIIRREETGRETEERLIERLEEQRTHTHTHITML